MIVYENDAENFIHAADYNQLTEIISKRFEHVFGRKTGASERNAWTNSLQRMSAVVRTSGVPGDCGILVEYAINPTCLRVDFVISGHDENGNKNFVIVELKQWSTSGVMYLDNAFVVRYEHGPGLNLHPSVQAKSYKDYLTDMNEAIYNGNISVESCSYLHNYVPVENDPIYFEEYEEVIEDTPVFVQGDEERLNEFLRKYVGKGKGLEILFEVENGKLRPSKKLVDYIDRMIKGNKVYTLLDQQAIAYAEIINAVSKSKRKTAIIVNGGPGTGKSVVAVNALVRLARDYNVRFATANAAFRNALIKSIDPKIKIRDNKAKYLFSGTSKYCESSANEFDVIIVDEAHRLKSKGTYMYKGESQVRDVINAARVSIFFVDDQQQIRLNDEGSRDYILQVAEEYGCEVKEVKLEAQFRCSGAEGFINWLDHTLQIRETANFDGWHGDFEFKLYDDPKDMYRRIRALAVAGQKARMVAGFAWEWSDDMDANIKDVSIPECGFSMPWNSRRNSTEWAIRDDMADQIGCVHTSQGLEFDYVGVIIGNDLRYDAESGKVCGSYEDYLDSAGKKGLKNDPEKLTQYIRQIYKILMSRGMKGCFVYVRNPALKEYIKSRLPNFKHYSEENSV